ncbi:uncharacterized protein OCT59_026855 [Rhizophagus irregularis]|uniref:uncharacterized protein n=1 Tax=Rhizophagus irregularis TaxID=588596 RepID=UPI00332C9A2E|nr:hypothetical protein OCT59_026855 [Rhizophagus irregularis]
MSNNNDLQEQLDLIKKQNEALLEKINSLDSTFSFPTTITSYNRPSTALSFQRPSSTVSTRRPSTSFTASTRRPSTSSSITSVATHSFIQKPKKKYISKADMLNALNISNEVYTTCVAAMRICADYQLEYNYAYKDIPKNILFKIIEKFKLRTKDLHIPFGFNDWFAYELLKKHVQHVRDHKAKNRNGYFKKRNQDEEEEEVRNEEQEEEEGKQEEEKEEEVRNEEQEEEEEEVRNEEQEEEIRTVIIRIEGNEEIRNRNEENDVEDEDQAKKRTGEPMKKDSNNKRLKVTSKITNGRSLRRRPMAVNKEEVNRSASGVVSTSNKNNKKKTKKK